MVIGYVMQKYPTLTLTFVYREVAALRAAGMQVETFSMWRPGPQELSREAQPLLAETYYIFPLNGLRFVRRQLRYLLTRPGRYLGTLAFCLRHDNASWGRRLRVLGHFLQGVYLAGEVERRGLQHLHAHFARGAATVALVAARLTGITFSFTAHANDLFVAPTMLPEKLAAARFAIAISEYNRQFLWRLAPSRAARDRVFVARCGIDVSRFTPAAAPANPVPLILGVGRLVEKKGFRYLIAACELLARRGYAFECEIVGDGPEAAALQRQIDAAGLAGRVRLAGPVFQEDLNRHLAAAQIFALPCVVAADGDMDGIPNSLMEAMAMEIPVVSTTLTGIPELVVHEQTGLLAPPRDAAALADALARLLDDPDLRACLGKTGRAKVVAEYELDKNARALQQIFASMLTPRASSADARARDPLRVSGAAK
jgi:colanic acid/amylovoran biosynthesis glycosyltransferase